MAQQYSPAEWASQKDRVDHLYIEQRQTLEQVRDALEASGFIVSKRSLRTKIKQWGLEKKRKPHEMRTALHILTQNMPSLAPDSCGETLFSIRGKEVSLNEIWTYYRRRDIYNPLDWLARHRSDNFQCSPTVSLIKLCGRTLAPVSYDDISSSTNVLSGPGIELVCDPLTQPSEDTLNGPWAILPAAVSMPHVEAATVHLLSLTRSYCTVYLESSRARYHYEPKALRNTAHGRFGHKIQDAMAVVLRGDAPSSALKHVNLAADEMHPLLMDHHPMSLAQILTVVCELAATIPRTTQYAANKVLQDILILILNFMRDLSLPLLSKDHPLTYLFGILCDTDHVLERSLRLMQMMVDIFEAAKSAISDPSHWRLLYLRERYYDCLYRAQRDGGRKSARAQLLQDQERFYGQTAPNVLWTLMNVADDHLDDNRVSEAERLLKLALDRAETLVGFAKAKARFAALEGLAKICLLKAGLTLDPLSLRWQDSGRMSAEKLPDIIRLARLGEADQLCLQAESDAVKWFGDDSRRGTRISQTRLDIINALEQSRT